MSPILTDGLRPVGRAWPGAQKRQFAAARKRLRSGFAFFLSDVCQGPPQGNKVTFARPDQWIEGWREVDPEEALLEYLDMFYHLGAAGRARDRVGDVRRINAGRTARRAFSIM